MSPAMIQLNTITRKILTLIVVSVTAVMVLTFSLSIDFISVNAGARADVTLCGNGSPPEYGFTYDLQQAHWTIDQQAYVTDQTVTEVDTVLDKLNADSVAQTMILILPQEKIGNRVNCAVHFLRYMQLGLPTGERKDNGFVFLIVVEPDRIDVHYGVGLGLPALTAPELTALNRAAEETFQSTHSMDEALLTLIQGFDTVARNKYSSLSYPAAVPQTSNTSPLPSGSLSILNICGLLCIGGFFLLFLLWALTQAARGGVNFNPSGPGSRGFGNPFGGGRSSGPSTRGGSGSGRSGRGN